MSQPQIVIDPDEELRIVCRLLFYNIPGFHPNAKKLHKACQEEGYSFRLQDIAKWVKYQYSYQIYQQPLPCKAEASFSKIKIPNKVHQCDILLHTHDDQDGRRVFVCSFLVIDVATRFKAGRSLTSRNSLKIWNAVEEIYEDPSNPLTWPGLLMTDGDASFRGAFLRGMEQHNVPIRVVDLYSFESLALIKAFKKNLAKLIYKVQYAIEGRLAEGERSRLWNKILEKYIDFMNNSKTRLIGMSPAHAMTLEEVESKPSSKAKRAIRRHEEIKLKKGTAVRYLLKPGELEGDHRHRATDPYWSLRVYKIKRVVVGRNPPQPELQVIEESDKIEYPPDEFMQKYHLTGFIHYVNASSSKSVQAVDYAMKRDGQCLRKTGQINGHDVYLWSCKNGAHQW
ncbi:17670_t:CDS:2, partial [Rhizophagus irregularis]